MSPPAFCDIYRGKGYGHGHHVAMLLDNRPEHFLHKLALNGLGVSCVPIDPVPRLTRNANCRRGNNQYLATTAPPQR